MSRPPSVASDLFWGALAGAAAVWAMDKVDGSLRSREPAAARRRTLLARPGGLDPAHVIATRAARALGLPLKPTLVHPAGMAVHYSVGAAMGAVFTALRLRVPVVGKWRGLAYGLAMSVLVDEGANTALKTAGRPASYPWQTHARGLAAHSVFGLAVDTLLRAIRGR